MNLSGDKKSGLLKLPDIDLILTKHKFKELMVQNGSKSQPIAAEVRKRSGCIKSLSTAVRSRDSIRFKEAIPSGINLIHARSLSSKKFEGGIQKPRMTYSRTKSAVEDSAYKISDPLKCRAVPGERSYEKLFRENVCEKEKDSNSIDDELQPESYLFVTPVATSISQNLSDTQHRPSTKTDELMSDTSLRKAEKKDFCLGCVKPENEMNFLGGLGPCVGNKRSARHPRRPTNIQKIFRMRTGNYPVFSLTENPRKTHCPVPRIKKADLKLPQILEKVELADNVDTPTPSQSSIVSCEVFDFENPMGLDLQGLDYKETYERDEQEIENQREYNNQLLHMKRRLMKLEIERMSEEKERKTKYAVPQIFDINTDFDIKSDEASGSSGKSKEDQKKQIKIIPSHELPTYRKETPEVIPVNLEPQTLAQLYRTVTKKPNQSVIEKEFRRRVDRYYSLWATRKQKERLVAEAKEEQNKIDQDNLVMNLGEQFFEDLLKDKYQEFLEMYESLPAIHVKRRYPHTLRETRRLQLKLNETKRIIRDKAIIKSRVFESKGVTKIYKEANLTVVENSPEDGNQTSLSEQSTDDEDDLFVGQTGKDSYQLRGFKFKLGTEPRGLKDRMHKTKSDWPLHTCQTRSSWCQKLVPDISPPVFFQYNPSSLKRKYLPNDPNIELFPVQSHPVREISIAPIKQYLANLPPQAYAPQEQVRLKIKKPKYMKVKKFNLTGFMYGARKQKKVRTKFHRNSELQKKVAFEKFFKQIAEYSDSERARRQERRHKRMRYMGIPFQQNETNKGTNNCNDSTTESSDWIPDDQEEQKSLAVESHKASLLSMGRSAYYRVRGQHQGTVANMQAPKFREPTLRNHPRRPRIKENNPVVSQGFSDNSVSIIANLEVLEKAKISETTVSSRAPYDVPRLAPIKPNAIMPANLAIKKTAFTKLFDTRHHHDHADPTAHKIIRVRYKNKLPELNTADKIPTEKVSKKKRPFEKALPYGKDYRERDLSVPQVHYEEKLTDFQQRKVLNSTGHVKKDDTNLYHVNEKNYRSRTEYENNLPEKSDYIEAIKRMAVELRRELENIKEGGNEFAINEQKYAAEVQKEIESIDSCVTSLESSICTNFTNDSGSYIMIQDKKVPCEYITKSFVPFEEIDRVRIKASRADAMDEYNAPYYTVPFAGQKLDQINLLKPSDKFFTYNERSRVGIRNRLEVKIPNFRSELIGTEKFKAPSKLATEWDANYQHDCPPIRQFKRKTTINLLREGMRKKFETLHILGQIAEQQIVQKKEVEYVEKIVRLRDMCQELFQKWQERHYHTSMKMIESIKPYYTRSDELKKSYSELQRKMTILNMRIVFLEGDWIRRIILQNFHYLIMEENWRAKYDWIHMQEDGTLENYRTSIDNRRIVNIRKRDRDDAWAIKEFYKNVYLPNKHPIEIVFPDAQTFNNGTIKLKIRTFICLLELHLSMSVLGNLQHEYNQFTMQSNKFIEQTTKFTQNRGGNKYFMKARVTKLEQNTRELMGEPLYLSVGSPRLRTIEPLCDVIYVNIIPQNIRNDVKEDCSALDKLEMIFNFLMDIIGQLDVIPLKKRQAVERKYRKNLQYKKGQSQQAFLIEQHIHLALGEIKRNMLPPYKKPKQTGKLPRIFFKKKHVVKTEVKRIISEKNRLFYQAFTESDGEEVQFEDSENSDILNSLQDNCIPFYYDHFLRLHDNEPNYDFKTQIEINEGPEEKRLLYKDVLPEVMKHLEMWKTAKTKKMEADIQKTLYLYVGDGF